MVEAATRCPSRRSSPWMRTTPHRRFSRARRTIGAADSSGTGGRPGALGWHHLAGISLRCRRSRRAGRHESVRTQQLGQDAASAASAARSDQVILGLGFARRGTATSCRSARISVSFEACDRANSASQDGTATSSR